MTGRGPDAVREGSPALLTGSLGEAALDLALDEILVTEAVFSTRIWQARQKAVVLGAASRADEELFLDNCRSENVEVLRRVSGGASVLLAPGVLCFGAVLPYEVTPGAATLSGAYALVARGVAAALEALGVPTRFERPGDLAAGGRKLVGLAQARRRRAALVHGVVAVDLDPRLLGRYVRHPPDEPAYRGSRPHDEFITTLRREGVKKSPAEVAAVLARHIAPGASGPQDVPPDFERRCRDLARDKYRDPSWTFRM